MTVDPPHLDVDAVRVRSNAAMAAHQYGISDRSIWHSANDVPDLLAEIEALRNERDDALYYAQRLRGAIKERVAQLERARRVTDAVEEWRHRRLDSDAIHHLLSAADAYQSVTSEPDPWRLAEWQKLPEVCLIAGCDNHDIDQRGPVQLRNGSIHKACVEHWEGVFRVLGEQASWERTDGAPFLSEPVSSDTIRSLAAITGGAARREWAGVEMDESEVPEPNRIEELEGQLEYAQHDAETVRYLHRQVEAQRDRMQPVVDAAEACVEYIVQMTGGRRDSQWIAPQSRALIVVMDAYRAGPSTSEPGEATP